MFVTRRERIYALPRVCNTTMNLGDGEKLRDDLSPRLGYLFLRASNNPEFPNVFRAKETRGIVDFVAMHSR